VLQSLSLLHDLAHVDEHTPLQQSSSPPFEPVQSLSLLHATGQPEAASQMPVSEELTTPFVSPMWMVVQQSSPWPVLQSLVWEHGVGQDSVVVQTGVE
jgi:hypothetical protein